MARLDRLCHKLIGPVYAPYMNLRLDTDVLLCILLSLLLTGCHAPLQSPLSNTQPTSRALALAVLAALTTQDIDQLESLALNGQEFREVVWPELPSSRPERGVPVSYAWNDLHQKSTNALRRLVSRWGGRTYTLLDVSYDGETTHYETFQVHRETRLHVRDTSGEEHEVHFYGSTLVRDSEFKIFSFVVD